MLKAPTRFSAGTAAALLVLAFGSAIAAQAPEPAKPVDAERLYTGSWAEIGRTPMSLTNGCVAGATKYTLLADNRLQIRDTCHADTPAGREKAIGGPATILDPGTNAKIHVSYRLFGFIPIGRDYWVLDHADDYSWFISADPTFTDLWIYSRNARMDASLRQQLINRAKILGYNVTKLEFPAQP